MSITVEIEGKRFTLENEERRECEIWSRIMGYFRPVNDWNKGKQSEFNERVNFDKKKVFSSK